MKALEILKKNIIIKISVEPNYLSEAIKELEELNNRSCRSCKHWNVSCINLSINTTGFCMYYGICNGDFEEDMKNSFCCNRYEKKDSE